MTILAVYGVDTAVIIKARAGVRGLSIVYPERNYQSLIGVEAGKKAAARTKYAVVCKGAGAWINDVTVANAVNGLDFGTYNTNGHVIESVFISSLPGTAIFVGGGSGGSDDAADGGKAGNGGGWVESVQGNLNVRGVLSEIRGRGVVRGG